MISSIVLQYIVTIRNVLSDVLILFARVLQSFRAVYGKI